VVGSYKVIKTKNQKLITTDLSEVYEYHKVIIF